VIGMAAQGHDDNLTIVFAALATSSATALWAAVGCFLPASMSSSAAMKYLARSPCRAADVEANAASRDE
jgi:hypothetical protein